MCYHNTCPGKAYKGIIGFKWVRELIFSLFLQKVQNCPSLRKNMLRAPHVTFEAYRGSRRSGMRTNRASAHRGHLHARQSRRRVSAAFSAVTAPAATPAPPTPARQGNALGPGPGGRRARGAGGRAAVISPAGEEQALMGLP